MSEERKSIGAGKIVEVPNKRLHLAIGNKVVKTDNLDDKSVTPEKIADETVGYITADVQNQIDSIQIGGWAISNNLGNDTHIGISQKALTELIGYNDWPGTIRGKIQDIEDEKGAASGIATLNAEGKVPSSQLPSYVDDVVEGYFYDNAFYADENHTQLLDAETGKIYLDIPSKVSYRYSGSSYVAISNPYFPDEEDLTVINDIVKFKDKAYSAASYSGLGRKYLRKNMVGGVNTLTQSMVNDANTEYIIQYDYSLNNAEITVPDNCVLKFEGGSFNNGTLRGNTCDIHGNGSEFTSLIISISGNGNVLKDFTIHRTSKSTSDHTIYTNAGVQVTGNNNILSNIESYYQNGPGITVNGKNNKVDMVFSHDNVIGMIVGNTTRNITITNSRFVNNDVSTDSGCDGILFLRTVIGAVIDNCELSYNGEHGTYFQGQNGTFTNNKVFGNQNNGLKFGSYDDGGYVYEGEELDLWVPGAEGVRGYDGVYDADGWGMKNIIISNNTIGEQATGNSGIYFQPSVTNLLISNNVINKSDITLKYFNYTDDKVRLEVLKNVSVLGNKIEDGDINIAAVSDLIIKDNTVVNGDITVYCQDASTLPYATSQMKNGVIECNFANVIKVQRTISCNVINNTINSISLNTSDTGLIIKGNTVASQNESLVNVIAEMSNNNITFNDGIPFMKNSGYFYAQIPPIFTNNIINLGADNDPENPMGTYHINEDTHVSDRKNKIITGNRITAKDAPYVIILRGSCYRFGNNTIINDTENENKHCVCVYGSKNALTGNVCECTGIGINLVTDSYHIMKNNIAVVNNVVGAETNIVDDNVS